MPRKPNRSQLKGVGERLALTRLALDVKQVEICDRIGVSASRWNNYEKDERGQDPIVMIRFANEFGISLDWIYRGELNKLPHDIAMKIEELRRRQAAPVA